jgi:signal transduction histidine kinase
VTGDRVQLEQVILNLMRNGIEAMQGVTSASRTLRIVTSWSGADALEVRVVDQGSGIAEPERVFEPFYTTKKEGLGMGLVICRSIVEAHGGRIRAERAPGGGAAVGFTLPFHRADALEPASD